MGKLLFIVATHGDEGFSIPVVKSMEFCHSRESCMGDLHCWVSGDFSWVVGNPPAAEKGVRFIDVDLNRIFPGDSQSNKWEVRRAAELMQTIRNHKIVIDIHGASCDVGICAIVTNPTPANIALANALPVENIVISAANNSLLPGHSHLAQLANSGLVLECGPKNSPEIASQLETVLARCIEIANGSCSPLCTEPKNWFASYGQIEQEKIRGCQNFVETEVDGERFVPFLVFDKDPAYKQYKASKMRRVDFWKLFEY